MSPQIKERAAFAAALCPKLREIPMRNQNHYLYCCADGNLAIPPSAVIQGIQLDGFISAFRILPTEPFPRGCRAFCRLRR
jgi:hypothetical protein